MNLNIFSVIRDEEKEMIMNNNLSASKRRHGWWSIRLNPGPYICLTLNRRLSLRQAVVSASRAGRPIRPDGQQIDGLGSTAGQRHRGGWGLAAKLNWCIHWGALHKNCGCNETRDHEIGEP